MHVSFFVGDKMILVACCFIEEFRKLGLKLIGHLHNNFIWGFPSASNQADSGLNGQDGFHDFVRFLGLISNVSILVHSKNFRIFEVRQFANILKIRFMIAVLRYKVDLRSRQFILFRI